MSQFDNRHRTSHRHNRTIGIVGAIVIVLLLVAGAFYSTGHWGAESTGTGAGAPVAQAPPGAGPNAAGAPNAGSR